MTAVAATARLSPAPDRMARFVPAAGLALAVTLAVVTAAARLAGSGAGRRAGEAWQPGAWATDAIAAVGFGVAGWFLASRRPSVAYGWAALAAGIGHGLAGVGRAWAIAATLGSADLPAPWVGAWLAGWGLVVEVPVIIAIYATYPDGRLPSGWWRVAAAAPFVVAASGVLVLALDPSPVGPDGAPALAALRVPFGLAFADAAAEAIPAFFAPAMVGATAVLVLRWARSSGERRRLLRWLVIIALVTLVVVPAVVAAPAGIGVTLAQAATMVELAVIVAATLRHHVYGIDLVLNRTLVYLALAGLVAVVYGAAIAVGAALAEDRSAASSFGGAMAAALVFSPARSRVQVGVNRLLYGERDDPYVVLSRVAERVDAATDTDDLLPRFVASTAQALRLPYVAVELDRDDGRPGVAHGTRPTDTEDLPLVHQGRQLGTLVIGRRAGEAALIPAERRLVQDLARQAAVAATNVLLSDDLRASRQRIVTARAEERRRLRRDLHDGLGPQLTGVVLGLDVLSESASRLDPALGADAERLGEEVRTAIADIRRLVHDLRPPHLDELGLLGALREAAVAAGRGGLDVVVDFPSELPALPAAVEVAAYRIATEAVTNVVRHAEAASSCTVAIRAGEDLEVAVTDDGTSLGSRRRGGVGLASIAERAEELGGRATAGPRPDRGWEVRAQIPLTGVR